MKAKKSLGQNFLKSIPALNAIIKSGEINPVRGREGSQRPSASNWVKNQDLVLEIGPGRGALTKKLLEAGAKVIAVEKDYELYEFLKNKFAQQIMSRSLVLVHDDILEFKVESYKVKSYKVIANIPYNITGAILKKFLTEKSQPECMVLMVQNEVAKRIVARDKKESILSISVKAYGEPKFIMKVPARYFSPTPKVDSAIIAIKNISRKTFVENNIDEKKFWEIVKTGFAHKRKKLSSNLKTLRNGSLASVSGLGNKRAEDLSLLDWIALAKI